MQVCSGSEVTFVCSTNLPATYPLWEIDSDVYDVTELPLGYRARGSSLIFTVYDKEITIRCSYLTRYTNGTFLKICSNKGTVEPIRPISKYVNASA